MWVRPATAADGNSVAELVAADRPPMLSTPRPLPRTNGAHEGLRRLYVAHDGSGQVLGAMALHRHARPGASAEEVTWLHCREDPAVAAVLVRAIRDKTADRHTVAAFSHPTEWPPHVPGLALHNRPVTTEAFAEAGFRTRHQWLLLHRTATPTLADDRAANKDQYARPVPWITPDGTLHTTRPIPPPPPPADVQHHLLRRSLEVLDQTDAHEALATVDLLAPDASPRCDILTRSGFEEVDLLRSLALY
ncbi:hypothetical protein ACIF6L_31670 [Kitasatospora sp. NPDC086009]|uniref:hypothetical protein n=1 Tax=unclassified Kitasatospora TaxID=2633591 RepID=UPI0037CB55C9